MAKKGASKAEQRRAKRKAEQRSKKKAAPRNKPKARKPKPSRPKARKPKPRKPRTRPSKRKASSRGSLRRTVAGIRRSLRQGRRATTQVARQVPRRDRLRAKRRRARNHLLATAALLVTTLVLVDNFSARSAVLWLIALGACVFVFRPSRDPRLGSQRSSDY